MLIVRRAKLYYTVSGIITPIGVSCLAETNRTPFDFAEGESELVSGFNVEYGGGGGVCFDFFFFG